MTAFVPPQQRASWQTLQTLAQQPLPHLRDLLAADHSDRNTALQYQAAGLRLDASHQRITPEVQQALNALAAESDVMGQALAQRRGEAINATEGRAVLHAALRAPADWADAPWGAAITAQVQLELNRFLDAAERIRDGRWCGHSGQRIRTVVNIGIGGSDLGPRLAVRALSAHGHPGIKVKFVSNPDAWSLYETLRPLDPAQTLFVVQSKTFTTQETMTLAASARQWLADHGIHGADQAQHLIAVTASPHVSAAQGYAPEHTFGFWDWVGGRYSVWSAIGLPLAIAIGAQGFRDFLAGAHAMDRHFWVSPVEHNMPLQMALLGIWNRNFLGCPSLVMAPYASRLLHLAYFVRQMDMESNGKRTHVDGSPVQVDTGPIVWGGLGIEGQHAFFQLLHQGTHRVTLDFVGVSSEDCPLPQAAEHHRVVTLNLRAQADALACGRDETATQAQLQAEGLSPERVRELTPHRTFPGNVSSNTLCLPDMSPHSVGALMALYEHKVFCQAAIWGIYAYDQWGVELGKTLARQMEQAALAVH